MTKLAAAATLWSILTFGLIGTERAHAEMTFAFTTSGSVPQNVQDAFAAAGDLWSTILEDDVTVRVTIGWQNMGGGVLGATGNNTISSTLTNVRNSLTTDSLSPDDALAVASLPGGSSQPIWINRTSNNPNGAGSATPYLDNDGDANNTAVIVARANARALGLLAGGASGNDGSITFNSAFSWDFDRSNGITGGQYDLVGIAAHEIGHLLGFVSGVDTLDQVPGQSDSFYNDVTPPDLFRFSTASAGQNAIDFTANSTDKFFSLDRGASNIAQFAEGVSFGDGRQASHWKDGLGIGIMDPTASAGEFLTITEADTRLMDAIGWNRNFNKYWISVTGGAFGTKRFWHGDVPQAIHTAIFDLPNEYSVSFISTARVSERLKITDGEVTFTFTTGSYTMGGASAASPSIVVAEASGETASLTLTGGTTSGVYGAIGQLAGSNGSVTASGATTNFNFSQSLGVGGTSTAAGGTGLLTVTGGATVRATDTLKVWGNGEVHLAASTIDAGLVDLAPGGRLQGAGNVDANLVNSGEVAPGASPGILNVIGDYSQSGSGDLEIEIGGLTVGAQYDRLAVSGSASLDGDLILSLINSFVPGPGSLFDVLTFASATGTFDNVVGATFGAGAGEFFVPIYTAGDLTLYVPLGGDANFDGIVDGADFTIWGDNFGAFSGNAEYGHGDFNGDGFVDGADFTVWGDGFGDSVDFNAMMAIPEPASLALAALAGCGIFLVRRKR